jgi:alpha,alpha-trehalose phosphorylase
VDVVDDAATYELIGDEPLTIEHFGQRVDLHPGERLTLPVPELPDPGPAPTQPRGRAPREILAAHPVERSTAG